MSHETTTVIIHSMLEPFNPDNEHYQGVREHFGPQKLLRIDQLRAKPDSYNFTFSDRLFIHWALGKVVMTASNPTESATEIEED